MYVTGHPGPSQCLVITSMVDTVVCETQKEHRIWCLLWDLDVWGDDLLDSAR